eukprot:6179264-Pleurochrysis_carterae.AAC.1
MARVCSAGAHGGGSGRRVFGHCRCGGARRAAPRRRPAGIACIVISGSIATYEIPYQQASAGLCGN